MKKNLLYLMTIIFAALSIGLVSCSNDSDDTPSNPLIGTWRAEVEEKGHISYAEITFKKDLTMTYKEYDVKTGELGDFDSGKYKIDGNYVFIYWSNGESSGSKFTITDGKKLVLPDFDDDIIYTKIK
ncbi:MAG: lipocalin family protein [Bacteroidaceae bacterium]|nr:lipocalin family protein [Bacteroidaceae bacterium]